MDQKACRCILMVCLFLSLLACGKSSNNSDQSAGAAATQDFYVVDQYNLELFFQGNEAFPVEVGAEMAATGGDGAPLTWMVRAGTGISLGRESGKAYFYVDPSSIDDVGSFVFFVGELCDGAKTPCMDQPDQLNFMGVGEDGLIQVKPYTENARRWQMRVYENGLEFVSNDCLTETGEICEYVTALKGGELFAVQQAVGTSMNEKNIAGLGTVAPPQDPVTQDDADRVQKVPLQARVFEQIAEGASGLHNYMAGGTESFWRAVRDTAEQAGNVVRDSLETAASTAADASVVASGELVSGVVRTTYDVSSGIQRVSTDVSDATLAAGGAIEDASRRAAYAVADGAVYAIEFVERNACIIVTGGIASGAVAAISAQSEGARAMARAALEGFKDFTKEQLIEIGKGITNPLVSTTATITAPALMLTGLNRYTSELIITAGLNNAIYGEPFVDTPPTNREEAKEFATGLWQAFVVEAAINVRCDGGNIVDS